MENGSLLKRFTRLVGQVGSILNRTDLDMLDKSEMRLVGTIKRLMADARLDIRDWEMADSKEEMQKGAEEALERLNEVRASILLASEHNLFTAIDIAEITAQFDQVVAELKR